MCRTLLASLAVVFAGWAWLLGLKVGDLDPRTPWWLRKLAITKPWRNERAECAEGGHCVFRENHFWSPDNATLNNEILSYFFTRVSGAFKHRLEAGAVAVHKRYLQRMSASGEPKPPLGLFQIGSSVPVVAEVAEAIALNHACGNNLRWVLVEPQEPIIKEVEYKALSAGFGPERTFVVNAAICPSADRELELWKFKDGTAAERSDRMGIVRMMSTLGGKDVLLNTWRRGAIFPGNLPVEERHEEDLEDWVEAVPVKCHTPATLLKEVRMEASNVDYLIIDTEGYDAEILSLFRDLPGFNPAVIIIEYAHHHASRGKVSQLPDAANYWSSRGYAVYKDFENLVMFKTDGS